MLKIKILLYSLVFVCCFTYAKAAPPTQEDLYEFGVRVRSMMAAYQPDDEKANIFIPTVKTSAQPEGDYLKRKGKICVFASGGLGNAWEKTVSKAYSVLYDEDIKIIRASWIRKHIEADLEEKYKAKPQELHAELFFMLCAKKFKPEITHVNAFSWWRPCDACYRHMVDFHGGTAVSYKVSYARPYAFTYVQSDRFKFDEICDHTERAQRIWQDIWRRVVNVVDKPFAVEVEKRTFWSKDYRGICLSKWLAQVFVDDIGQEEEESEEEGQVSIGLPNLNLQKISPSLVNVDKKERQRVFDLMIYLRRVNWEFSCWYRKLFPEPVQKKWKRYWQGTVLPHFEWEHVGQARDEGEDGQQCEICGYEGIKDLFYVYHGKHTPSQKKDMSEQYKRKKSLTVGSECVQILTLTKEAVKVLQAKAIEKKRGELRKKKQQEKERAHKRREAQEREEQDRELEKNERILKERERQERLRLKEQERQEREERKHLKEQKRQERKGLTRTEGQTRERVDRLDTKRVKQQSSRR